MFDQATASLAMSLDVRPALQRWRRSIGIDMSPFPQANSADQELQPHLPLRDILASHLYCVIDMSPREAGHRLHVTLQDRLHYHMCLARGAGTCRRVPRYAPPGLMVHVL